jgi:phospholipase/carboxylesterase
VSAAPRELIHVAHAPRAGGPGPHPALVLLHGRGADEADLLPLVDVLDPRFFVVSARAPLPLGGGYAWYHLIDLGNPDQPSFRASLASLAQFVANLPTAYPIDPGRIFTVGFSQGAMMAGSLLLTHPTAMAGTVMLSGYLPLGVGLPVDEAALRGRPVFVGHGTADQVIPVSSARQARDYFERVGADLSYHEYPIGHYIADEELSQVAGWLSPRVGP